MLFDRSKPEIGLHTRHVTLGSELALVEQFIDYYREAFLKANKNERVSDIY